MFALFYSLYLSMFTGVWNLRTSYDLFQWDATQSQKTILTNSLDSIGKFLTSIFGDGSMDTLGTDVYVNILEVISLVLALMTSIGIVVMAVKGVKKAFGIFFGQIR